MTAGQRNADTFSDAGLVSGSIMDKAACTWPDTSIWVVVDGRGECLRYFHSGLQTSNPLVHIWFHGDRMSHSFNGDTWAHGYYRRDASAMALKSRAEREFSNFGIAYIRFSRPGVYGSSGDHKQRRRPYEIKVINAAVDALKQRYGIDRLALSGQSGGGHVVASLLTMRDDITCAVSTSGAVAVGERVAIRGWPGDVTGYTDYFDPIDHVAKIPANGSRRIFLVGDPEDSNVPFATQLSYHKALKAAGHQAWLIRAAGRGSSRHSLSHIGFLVIKGCVDGLPPDEIAKVAAGQGGS